MQTELVCHWCNKPRKNVQLVTESKTHGICPACLKQHFALTVQEMYQRHIEYKEEAKLAKAKKRQQRREAKRRRG